MAGPGIGPLAAAVSAAGRLGVGPAGEVVRSFVADAERHLRVAAHVIGTP